MPLLTFSIREHVPLILSGEKAQTTRLIGKRKLAVGDTLYLYFKPRMKKGTCLNCIRPDCPDFSIDTPDDKDCRFTNYLGGHNWKNYFGEAIIESLLSIKEILDWDWNARDEWAKLDGFKDFREANKWFTKKYGKDWMNLPFQVISWKPKWEKKP